MAERDDSMARDARNAQSGANTPQGGQQGGQQAGQQAGQQGNQGNQGGDDRQALDEALKRRNEDLAGDIETNRNLTGSTTYETLSEQGDLDVVSGQGDQGSSGGSRSGGSSGGQGGSSGGMR